MEEDKNKEQPEFIQQSDLTENPPQFSQTAPLPEKKSPFGNIKKDIAIIVGVFLLLVVGFVVYQVIGFTGAITGGVSDCEAKTKRLQSQAAKFKTQLNTITVNGQAANSVEANPDGDCLTGKGTSGTAEFNLGTPTDVATANAQIIQSIHSSTVAEKQKLTLNDGNPNSSQIHTVDTTIDANGEDYAVTYYLQTPIDCQASSGSTNCQLGPTAVQTYDIMHKPLGKVIIRLYYSDLLNTGQDSR